MAADAARMAGPDHERALNDDERLADIRRFSALDTHGEQAYGHIVNLVRTVFRVQIAAISIVDGHRVWLKSSAGTDITEADRRDAFSRITIAAEAPFIVPDATKDERFADNPYVTGPPHVRSYVGVPVKSPSGHSMGAICAVDTKPREFGSKHVDVLKDFAALVSDRLELRARAMTDGLTGVLTRRAFREQGVQALSLASRHRHHLTAIYFDLDHFKSINDTYGHAAGDEVLREVASAAKLRMRKSDIFARPGGEEFAVLLPQTDRKGAMEVAEKLRKDISALRFEFDGRTIGVTASFGVASFDPDSMNDLETLLVRTDAALYQAKGEGRNRCVAFGGSEVSVKAARRRVLKAGKVTFNNGGASIDCTVRTLGHEGAGLDLISTADVPNEFRLVIRADGLDASCSVTSRTQTHLEVEFR